MNRVEVDGESNQNRARYVLLYDGRISHLRELYMRPGARRLVPVWVAVALSASVSWGCERDGAAQTATSTAGLQTAELHVQGTDCASCDVSIRRYLRKLEGVRDIRPGSDKQHVFVDFDPTRVTPEQIAKAVLEAGYEAEILVHSMAT